MTLNALVFTQKRSPLGPLWNKPLIKDAHEAEEKRFSTASRSGAGLARPLLVICSELLLGVGGVGGVGGIPGQARHVPPAGPPPPGPAARWPTPPTLPSVLPPVGELAERAAHAALP